MMEIQGHYYLVEAGPNRFVFLDEDCALRCFMAYVEWAQREDKIAPHGYRDKKWLRTTDNTIFAFSRLGTEDHLWAEGRGCAISG